MTRVVIYCRFSPRPDAALSESNAYQLDLCRLYAARNGWEVVAELQDSAFSGDSFDRPGLWAAIDELKRGYVLLCHKLDRLSRDEKMDFVIRQYVEKAGARIVSVVGEGTASQSPEDILLRRILQALAEYMKLAQGARTRAAMQRHQANGRRMGRADRLPYGWRADFEDPRRMVIASDEQGLIKEIKFYKSSGMTSRQIAGYLNGRGVFCRGKPWRHQLVCRILARS